MLFCTQTFVLFFAAVFVLYWTSPWAGLRTAILLLASLIFYASWSEALAAVVVSTACLDYALARGIDATTAPRTRRLLLLLSIGTNLAVLGYFKYANFFLESLGDLARRIGAERSMPLLEIVAPLGISFYTFEAISYTVDVYRGKIRAERNLAHFLLFILFFPHLIAGPIVRAGDFLPQIRRRKRWNWARMSVGVQLCALGAVKKLAIADRMALFADPVFADPLAFKTSALWMGSIAYLVQVYCDFSGYSDIALGTAHLLGYRLCRNFNLPYLAENVSDFWRRWHISLSNWLRDYVFFPLRGSRGSLARTCLNLMVLFTLCGLWHGAAWRFVAWGFLTGVWMCAYQITRPWMQAQPWLNRMLLTAPGTALRIGSTVLIFMLTLVIFRAPTLVEGFTMLGRLFVPVGGERIAMKPESFVFLTGIVIIGYLIAAEERWQRIWERLPTPARGLGLAGAMAAALLFAPDAGQSFIYFQF